MSNTKIQLKRVSNTTDLNNITLSPGECVIDLQKGDLYFNGTANEVLGNNASRLAQNRIGSIEQPLIINGSTVTISNNAVISKSGLDISLQSSLGGGLNLNGMAIRNVGNINFSPGSSGDITSPGTAKFDTEVITNQLQIKSNNISSTIISTASGLHLSSPNHTGVLTTTEQAAQASSPSGVDMKAYDTTVASGTAFTAPFDGIFAASLKGGTSLLLFNRSARIASSDHSASPTVLTAWIPVASGQEFTVNYSGGTFEWLGMRHLIGNEPSV